MYVYILIHHRAFSKAATPRGEVDAPWNGDRYRWVVQLKYRVYEKSLQFGAMTMIS